MKKRNPAAVLLLPFVTLGIYCIYWLYATRKELLSVNPSKKESIPPVFVLLLPILLIIALIVTAIFAGGDTTTTSSSENEPISAAGVVTTVMIILFFVGGLLVLPLWWFYKYCRVAVEITKGKGGMDFTQLYVLYVAIVWLCGIAPVWMLIAQLEFNKVIDHDHPSPHDKTPHPLPTAS